MDVMPAILLIDDDPDFVEATCAVLESVPYEVLVAYNGTEGLAKAREARPDLIILDVIMPVEDGFQTLEKLRSDPMLAQIPVMMLTSLSNDLNIIAGPEADVFADDCDDYVNKPTRPTELLRRVKRLLGQRKIQPVPRNSK